MWMGGGGPAADAAGSVYVISGNGFGDTPGTNSYGNSFVRLTNSSGLKVADYFTPYNTINEDNGDVDFGSAAPLLLPDMMDANCTSKSRSARTKITRRLSFSMATFIFVRQATC